MKILDADISNIRRIVESSIVSTEQHIATFIPNCQRWHYGRELRMRIISELAGYYPGSTPVRQSYRIVLGNGFSFFVSAEQDFHRSANYKRMPDLFDTLPADTAAEWKDGDYELVVEYEAPFFIYASLIPHNAGFPIISILEGRPSIVIPDTKEYNESEKADFEINGDIISKTGTSNE